MQFVQRRITSLAAVPDAAAIAEVLAPIVALAPQVVMVFAAPAYFTAPGFMDAVATSLGEIPWLGCSTAGEVFHIGVDEESFVATGIRFDAPVRLRLASARCADMEASRAAGAALASRLAADDLTALFLLSPGVLVNGSEIIAGVRAEIGSDAVFSGGLAGDGSAFVRTYTVLNGTVSDRDLVGLGFYGEQLAVLTGSYGGWQTFGPVRTVTRSAGNVLYEMDGEPALALYRRYLGDYADGLPGTGLLFPLALLGSDRDTGAADPGCGLIRTLTGIDDAAGSLIFAGDIPQGQQVRMMQASVNALVDGAQKAAETAAAMLEAPASGLALLVSCVGRKLVMAGRTEEEVEAVADTFGQHATVAGFYSYGEISPGTPGTDCRLHNQTMTITYLVER